MTAADEIEQLRAVPMFAELDEDVLRRVALAAAPFEVKAGHVLVERGQPGSGMFVITEGTVEVLRRRGRTITLGPGEFVGELALLADVERVARVRATTAVKGLAISRAAFGELLREEPRIAVAMLPTLVRRLVAVESEQT